METGSLVMVKQELPDFGGDIFKPTASKMLALALLGLRFFPCMSKNLIAKNNELII